MPLKYIKIRGFATVLPKERRTWRCVFALRTSVRKSPRAVESKEEQGELCSYSCAIGSARRVKKEGVICTCWGLCRLNERAAAETATRESFGGTLVSPASLIRS